VDLRSSLRSGLEKFMSEAQFSTWAVRLGVGGMIALMFFIVYSLARDSKAGKYGTVVLMIALMMGVLGFSIKAVVQWLIER
jgi:uncharacterized membrane protein